MKKICGIYMIKNTLDDKKYIGKSNDIIRRWYEHKYDLRHNQHDNSYLQRAWNKYGEENFEFLIVESNIDELCLDQTEMFYINLYNTNNKRFGYNLTNGGDGGTPTLEAIENMKIATRKRYNEDGKAVYCPELNQIFSCAIEAQEHTGANRQGISACCNGAKYRKTAGKHPVTKEGLHWFFANDVDKIEAFMRGEFERKHFSLFKQVTCLELDKTFDSIKDASDYTGIHASNISMCCNGTIQSAGKHPITGEKLHWIYTNQTNNSSVA